MDELNSALNARVRRNLSMKVIYPPLVEQSYQFITQQGIKVSKAEVYQ